MGMQHRKIAYRNPALWAAVLAILLLSATATLVAAAGRPDRHPRPPSPEEGPDTLQGAGPLADTWTAAEPDAMGYWLVRGSTP